MIIQEEITCNNGMKQIHTYSNKGNYVLQKETGIKYVEAYDNEPLNFTYEETDEYAYKESDNS